MNKAFRLNHKFRGYILGHEIYLRDTFPRPRLQYFGPTYGKAWVLVNQLAARLGADVTLVSPLIRKPLSPENRKPAGWIPY